MGRSRDLDPRPPASSYFEDRWRPAESSIAVHEPDGPRWTGLYDAGGRKLFEARAPIGFRIPR